MTGRGKRSGKSSETLKGMEKQTAQKNADNSEYLLEIDPIEDQHMIELEDSSNLAASIKVVGIGGGGGNAINTMIDAGLAGVDFISTNTDAQALQHNKAPIRIQLGTRVTRGLGCGANPEKGRSAALEDRDRLRDLLIGADMVFLTAGLGGGTGTGAAPVIAEVAREVGALTVGVVTKPFGFEGKFRSKQAERGLDELHGVVDTLITIPNQRLLALAGKGTSFGDAFTMADEVCLNAVRGISDLITVHGLINLDFADVRTIMNEMGNALMGTGTATGETRAVEAAQAAISSPLLEDVSIEGARGLLINVTGNRNMSLFEVNEAAMLVQDAAHDDANIIFGAVVDEDMPEDELRVTVIATGLDDGRRKHREPQPETTREPETSMQLPLDHYDAPAPASLETSGAEIFALDTGADFVSPFEEELDVPTFIRKKKHSEEDRDHPTFLRSSAD